MKPPSHSPEFRTQALIKARTRGTRTLKSVAQEINLPLSTLKGWLQRSNKEGCGDAATSLSNGILAANYGPAERLAALLESHSLSGSALHAWCREKGLFEHQLQSWHAALCSASDAPERELKTTVRELQNKNEQLRRDLHRKDRALAETAALLVLQKKFQALLEGADT